LDRAPEIAFCTVSFLAKSNLFHKLILDTMLMVIFVVVGMKMVMMTMRIGLRRG